MSKTYKLLTLDRLHYCADIFAQVLLILLVLVVGYTLVSGDREQWVGLLTDDAYYYLGLARNIIGVGHSFFSPPFETNGFQPLWMFLLIVCGEIIGVGEKSLVAASLLLSFFCLIAFLFFSKKKYGMALPAIVATLYCPEVGLRGMETALLPILCVVYVSGYGNCPKRGMLASMIFLARLDSLSLVVVWDVLSLVVKGKSLWHWFIVIPVVISYFVWNNYEYGVMVPISGLSKTATHGFTLNPTPLGQFIKASIPLSALAGLLLLASRMFCIEFIYTTEIVALIIVSGVNAFYYSIASGWCVWEWYFWPYAILIFYLTLELIHQISVIHQDRRLSHRYILAFVSVLLYSIYIIVPILKYMDNVVGGFRCPDCLATSRNGYGVRNVKDAAYFSALGSKSLIIGMGDRAGSLGYFLVKDSLFQAEGLVSPVEYWKAIRNDQGDKYLESIKFDYWVVDRGRLIEQDDIIGIVEPVQPFDARAGNYILCFAKSSVVKYESSADYVRAILLWSGKVPCTNRIIDRFMMLRREYGLLRQMSMPAEFPYSDYSINILRKILY